MKKAVRCIPVGGIGNRLKCIISALAEYRIHLTWRWSKQSNDEAPWCEFNDFFENDFTLDKSEYNVFPYLTVSDCKFIHDHVDRKLKKKYLKQIKNLVPVKYVRDEIKNELKKFPEKFDVVSVRTFKNDYQTINENPLDQWIVDSTDAQTAKKLSADTTRDRARDMHHAELGDLFNVDKLYSILDAKILDNSLPFLLTSDNTDLVENLKNRYPNKVLTTPKRTEYGDFMTVEGIQDILIDLYLGGHGQTIYGTYPSSFCELQWWFGMCKPTYIDMDLH